MICGDCVYDFMFGCVFMYLCKCICWICVMFRVWVLGMLLMGWDEGVGVGVWVCVLGVSGCVCVCVCLFVCVCVCVCLCVCSCG